MSVKIPQKEQAEIRASLYEAALTAIVQMGFTTEKIKDCSLINLGDGKFARLKISICGEKFDEDKARTEYAEDQARIAERKAEAEEKKRLKEEEKARKKAEKEAQKAE